MDLDQRKLNKSEWETIEVPVSQEERNVLNLIIRGYHDVQIKISKCSSMLSFLKIEQSERMEDYLYLTFFHERVDSAWKRYKVEGYPKFDAKQKIHLKSADRIRLENTSSYNMTDKDIYEFVLLQHLEELVKQAFFKNQTQFLFHYYTLYKLIQNNVTNINRHVLAMSRFVLSHFEDQIGFFAVIANSSDIIEKNKNLLKYADLQLYEHQKEIFTLFKSNKKPKLVLYIAPTGTGKTLTPLALSEQYRIIFVCAARHVGLALAKAAISMEKKIAFAFGCATAKDIRLHYYAAAEYTIDKKSGGIGKVDNENGVKVEIMVCDIKSYYPAMLYMKAFNRVENIITYWDEPTITMDYDEHAFHSIISRNWSENIIPNVVLSSATLPKLREISTTVTDFMSKFPTGSVTEIISHDCKKSIPLIDNNGYAVLPHFLSTSFAEVQKIATFTESYLTLLRYFDLREVSDFISYMQQNNLIPARYQVERYFETLDEFDMKKIKMYYLTLLQNLPEDKWEQVSHAMRLRRKVRLPFNETVDNKGNKITKSVSVGPSSSTSSSIKLGGSNAGEGLRKLASVSLPPTPPSLASSNENKPGTNGLLVTTKDAYTLTDGPTIFISDDVEKIARFCIQQANIPPLMMKDLMEKIDFNNVIIERIQELEVELEEALKASAKSVSASASGNVKEKDIRKINREGKAEKNQMNEIAKITSDIQALKETTKLATLNDTFVPNKRHHLEKWAQGLYGNNSFTSSVDEITVNKIMTLSGVDDSWKILLLMGIGVFTRHENATYTEIMKQLAIDQKLYLIIATSDYIYGTNYSFCHGYLSKDLNLTQEKIIQALGRIGRNNIQQDYTVRFRGDEHIMRLFTEEEDKPEVRNMNRLFNSANEEFVNASLREEIVEEA